MNGDFTGTNKTRPDEDVDSRTAPGRAFEQYDLGELLADQDLQTASELADAIRAKPGLLDKVLGG